MCRMDGEIVIHGELVAQAQEFGDYTVYVFLNLDESSVDTKYFMCTRMPNWEQPILDIGDKGYVAMKEVVAGVDKWYDRISDKFVNYGFSQVYFIKFIREVPKIINLDNNKYKDD